MEKLSSSEIRKRFLEYFEKNDHLKISASSVVPQNDPTLLFINSGMAPLKNYFLGKEQPPKPRLCNFQPCVRTKDIDDVGDRHHLTIFEMMGSWSIGDYYKEKACSLAYGLLVDGLGFDPKKLYMTVYGGNKNLGIAPDTESIEAWKNCGVAEDHIIVLGDDNFWGPAGETGPCGPCTEVFYDTGSEYGPEYKVGGHFDDVSRYIEIWNAGVFMELNKGKDGTFVPLPLKSVDTGSGLERLAMVMNGCDSVYETDLLLPLVELSTKLIGSNEGEANKRKIRMISDHMRAAIFILGEGVAPSNEGQGYIPRRLIRKVVAALMSAKVENIEFSAYINKVIELLGDHYPQLRNAKEMITYNLETELKEFMPTVKEGLERIEKELAENKTSTKLFPGKMAFELVTTFGLPLEVIKSDLEGREIKLDEAEFEKCYEEHRKASRVISRKSGDNTDQDKLELILATATATNFKGYDENEFSSSVSHIINNGELVGSATIGDQILFVTNETPFYGESGGQAGDIGLASNGDLKVEINDTMKIKNIHVHVASVTSGTLSSGSKLNLVVDRGNKNACMRNHSATHLMHAALHEVIGKHAVQKGSLVRADRLRFDFQNNQAVTKDELNQVEALVNKWIMENHSRETELCSYDKAIEKGAMALFGEKYDSNVRVVNFGTESVELCGGTHVTRTGDIGLFVISSESSVAKGIRRIEAVTGIEAVKSMQERNNYLRQTAELLGAKPKDFEQKIKDLKKKSVQKKEKKNVSASDVKYTSEKTLEVAGSSVFIGYMNADAEAVKQIGDQMIEKGDNKVICLLGSDGKTVRAFAWVAKELTKKVKAGDVLKKVLLPIDGKGGGKPHFAQGGSPKLDEVSKVFEVLDSDVSLWFGEKLS